MYGAHNRFEDESGRKIVICDNGTGFIKAGLAGETYPRAHFPCVVGRPAKLEVTKNIVAPSFIGQRCLEHDSQLHLSHPITNGVIQNWDDMRSVWGHAFLDVLQVDPKEHRILLTEPPLNPKGHRRLLMDTMFETFGFSGVYFQIQAVLALYSQGLMTGVIVDSGDALTHAVPVIEGRCSPAHIKRLNIGGRHISAHLAELLRRRGYTVNGPSELEGIRVLKERCCYVALDYERELQLARETTCLMSEFTLPDGQVISLDTEKCQAAEALFQPSLMEKEGPGISEVVHACIHDLPIDARMGMYHAVLLSGGTTMLPGLSTRLTRDLTQLYLNNVLKGREAGLAKLKLQVEDPPNRKHMVFVGAAILADVIADFDALWISKAEYEEDPTRALSKCASFDVFEG